MESNYFIELHDGIEVYYPLGISAFGAATAVVVTSPEAKRAARRTMRWVFYLGWAYVVLVIASIRFLGAGFIAVPVDLLSLSLHNSIAKRNATQFGQLLPPQLARKLCAEAIGDRLDERIVQCWMLLAMSAAFMVLMAFGNMPALWTLGVTGIVSSVLILIQTYRLAAAASR